jgi:hypothetical protein
MAATAAVQPTSVHSAESVLFFVLLQLIIISRHVFTMLVILAIISTSITAPVLHRYLSRVADSCLAPGAFLRRSCL